MWLGYWKVYGSNDGRAEEAFREDLAITRTHRVHGFPSYLVKTNDGKYCL